MQVLTQAEWQARAAAHRARIEPLVAPQVARQSRGEKHPVYDFLFQYYSFPTKRLVRWHPGFGVALAGDAARDYLRDAVYSESDDGVSLDASRFPAHRRAPLRWIMGLLEKVTERAPRFGCYGLHEWAMVYRIGQARHAQLPLRMNPEELAAFVESQTVCCSHYDAFRFFTPAARPLNTMQPQDGQQPEMEQRGCVHANMDLYKWAYKFFPWIGSDLIADCLLFAADARELDMRVSAYDCRSLGFEPIPVETEEGRNQYVELQRAIAERSVPLRARLLDEYRHIAAAVGDVYPGVKTP